MKTFSNSSTEPLSYLFSNLCVLPLSFLRCTKSLPTDITKKTHVYLTRKCQNITCEKEFKNSSLQTSSTHLKMRIMEKNILIAKLPLLKDSFSDSEIPI